LKKNVEILRGYFWVKYQKLPPQYFDQKISFMKDNFSKQAATYANFRPNYPSELFDFILQNVDNKQVAWDCATGNGQAAKVLAAHFEQVFASDSSQAQIEKAVQKPNIHYSVQAAEMTDFAGQSFDLITVAQAVHWFNFDKFYQEIRRVAKPNATVAIWGYSMPQLQNDALNPLLQTFYAVKTRPYWDAERRHIDEHYSNVPFPFNPIPTPQYRIEMQWNLAAMEGYLNSWSAVQHFIRREGYNPVDNFMADMRQFWQEDAIQTVHFPLFLKLGKV
jgi:ubiquinone/menaquinone biosynthesis C-methylase UbiE